MHVAAGGHLHAMICEAVCEDATQAIQEHGPDSSEARKAVDGGCKAWEQWVSAPVAGTADALSRYQAWLQGLPEGLVRAVPDRIPKVSLPHGASPEPRHCMHERHAGAPAVLPRVPHASRHRVAAAAR